MQTTQIINTLGFAGALLGSYAYLPQIKHLVAEKCSAGISARAFKLWTLSSSLVLINAIYVRAPVFIFLSFMQLLSSFTILMFSLKSKGHVCQSHLHGTKEGF